MSFTGKLGVQNSKPGHLKLGIVNPDTSTPLSSRVRLDVQAELIANPIFELQSSPDFANSRNGSLTLQQIAGFWIDEPVPFIGILGHQWAELGNFVLGLAPQNISDSLSFQTTASFTFSKSFTFEQSLVLSVNSGFVFTTGNIFSESITISCHSNLIIVGTFILNQFINSIFLLSQILEAHLVSKPTFNTLSFIQNVTVIKISLIPVGNILTFRQTIQTIANLNINVSNSFKPFNGNLLNIGGGIPIISQPAVTGIISTPRFIRISVPNRLILLPTPLLGDGQQALKTMKIGRSLNSVRFTYLKRTNLQHLSYTFRLGRIKSLELRDFILNFADKLWTLVNWKGENWRVFLMNDPVELIGKSRYINDREEIDVTLELEGSKIP